MIDADETVTALTSPSTIVDEVDGRTVAGHGGATLLALDPAGSVTEPFRPVGA